LYENRDFSFVYKHRIVFHNKYFSCLHVEFTGDVENIASLFMID